MSQEQIDVIRSKMNLLEDEVTSQMQQIENYNRENHEYQLNMESAHNVISDHYTQIAQLQEELKQITNDSEWSQKARNTIKSLQEDIIAQEEKKEFNNLTYNENLSKINACHERIIKLNAEIEDYRAILSKAGFH